jgi:Iron-containing redox enzyme
VPADQPQLPEPRGPVSGALIGYLRGADPALGIDPSDGWDADDLQLALYVAYELHYRSFAEVDDRAEWDPAIVAFRGVLERRFEDETLAGIEPPACSPEAVGETLFRMAEEDDGPSLAAHLDASGDAEQFREFMIHRSAYQLKEADPHTWAVPRIHGAPKSALVEVQADEYGSGDPERMHSRLFANAMDALGLDSRYGAYVDRLPGSTLATVNLISLFGLHRRRRGALVGHLAMFEITSPGPNRLYGRALRRLGFGAEATDFYDEHVEADSVHENIAAYDLAQGLAVAEPALARDIVFGAQALLELDARMADQLLAAWERGESSLRPAALPTGA